MVRMYTKHGRNGPRKGHQVLVDLEERRLGSNVIRRHRNARGCACSSQPVDEGFGIVRDERLIEVYC